MLAFVLMLLKGISAGIGLLLIVPLLQLIGISSEGAADSQSIGILGAFVEQFDNSLSLPTVLLIYIGLVSTVALLNYYLAVLSTEIQQQYITFLRNRLYTALLRTRWLFIVRNKMSGFIHSLTGQIQSVGNAVQHMLQIASEVVLTVIYFTVALLLSWKMSILALACALSLLMILLPLNRMMLRSGQLHLSSYKTIFQMLSEQLASLKMIKSYASELQHADLVGKTGKVMEQQQIKATRINATSQMVYIVGSVIAFSILLYLSIDWLAIPLTTMLVLLVIYSRLLPRVMSVQTKYQRLMHLAPAISDVNQMLSQCASAEESPPPEGIKSPEFCYRILLDNITFSYEGESNPVLEGFTLEIRRNQTIALRGESGSGKSTVADLLAGLLPPTQGHIYCDETELTDELRQVWRQKVAYVTQEVYLLNQTVRDNLIWVQPSASDHDCWRVLELAAAAEFVKALPESLDTTIGDQGVRLSGGERQRLAIARALLSDPSLLILDEATSALDIENEQKIHQALNQLHGKLTIIVITHRTTAFEHVDKVVNLGGLSNVGKHSPSMINH